MAAPFAIITSACAVIIPTFNVLDAITVARPTVILGLALLAVMSKVCCFVIPTLSLFVVIAFDYSVVIPTFKVLPAISLA
jgi:hypothetical protein